LLNIEIEQLQWRKDMNADLILQKLDQLIESRSILNHPFYVAWQKGELSREQLETYARIYYPHVAAFPRYLKSACDVAMDTVVQSELEKNLVDEISNPKPHPELWLDFAESLGLDRIDVANCSPHPAASNIINTFNRISQNESIAALAALYAYESQQPEVSKQKSEGLRQHYGIDSPKALAYFDVHAEADIEHRNGEQKAIQRCLKNGSSEELLFSAAEEALDAYWDLLDGICEEAEIPVSC
jgi:pyrroloquinoline-quinone synthase